MNDETSPSDNDSEVRLPQEDDGGDDHQPSTASGDSDEPQRDEGEGPPPPIPVGGPSSGNASEAQQDDVNDDVENLARQHPSDAEEPSSTVRPSSSPPPTAAAAGRPAFTTSAPSSSALVPPMSPAASPRLALFAHRLARRSSGSGATGDDDNDGLGDSAGAHDEPSPSNRGGVGAGGTASSSAATPASSSAAGGPPQSPFSASLAHFRGASSSSRNQGQSQQPQQRSPLRSTLLAAAYPVGLLLSPQPSSSNSNSDSNTTSLSGRGRRSRRGGGHDNPFTRSMPGGAAGGVAVVDENNLLTADKNYRRAIRRFREGDYVLVSCHNYPSSLSGAARFGFTSSLVNQHGYPPNSGETVAEKSGPYKYVLAQVKELHFEEIVTYYTVTRCDTHQDQRADAEFMEPVRTQQGLEAAKAAAASFGSVGAGQVRDGTSRSLNPSYPSSARNLGGGSGGGAGGRTNALSFRASFIAGGNAGAAGTSSGGDGGRSNPRGWSVSSRSAALSSSGNVHGYSDRGEPLPSLRERKWWDAVRCDSSCRGIACRNACRSAGQAACWLPRAAYDVVVTRFAVRYLKPGFRRLLSITRRQASLVLNGVDPYRCRVRFTAVNFVVLCSIWYMFISPARLAFFPPSTDDAVAIVNLVVWAVLILDLILEVFIRPDGYGQLIVSEKAFAPTTERYISAFHLTIEFVSLLVFIPEFYCVLSPSVTCGDRLPFSFFNAALLGVIGPTRADVFCGQAFVALVRLRVIGLVRIWKNMWLANTFINQRWRGKHPGFLSSIVPNAKLARSVSIRQSKRHQLLLSGEFPDPNRKDSSTAIVEKSKPPLDPEVVEQRKRETALTNASTIGTALMVTNSYRALAILWVIVGLFPIVTSFLDQYTNVIAYEMTQQMQATNLLASDNNTSTCSFLSDSIWAWLTAIQKPGSGEADGPYLLTLDVSPIRCAFQGTGNQQAGIYCPNYTDTAYSSSSPGQSQQAENATDAIIEALCSLWALAAAAQSPQALADAVGTRVGSILYYNESQDWNLTDAETGVNISTSFSVASNFDASPIIGAVAFSCFILQLCFLVMVLGGLSVLRRDAEVLVLGPLRRMLKRVARYARNPLMPPKIKSASRGSGNLNQKRQTSTGSNADDDDLNDEWNNSDSSDDEGQEAAVEGTDEDMLGSYETEQLNSAVNKITDLLRKCWGVAGADIISTNLAARGGALTEMFNPTVPGKSVYALFGFVSINDFDHVLRELQDDVMILINDVAAVLHDEVFRWGFGHSGQCNKNLGSAFLMVFRIGLVKEVMEKLEQATDVVFSTKSAHSVHGRRRIHNRFNSMGSTTSVKSSISGSSNHGAQLTSSTLIRHPASVANNRMGSGFGGGGALAAGHGAPSTTTGGMLTSAGLMAHLRRKEKRPTPVNPMSLSLQSLPGITTFTDRAVIGMLKSFAGIYRDKKILNWNQDFRLGQGVGLFTVSMIFGMDAGWAVEGAVGSEYKIDATYLSPHVNMASRMMGACKQYGVTLMLSQAVQELMSDVARTKLRHLDTITVKGSSIKQRIYTYDARPKGVDFFLFNRTEDQADVDAERYTPQIWNTDQDLRAMRQHVTEDFLEAFGSGRKAYLAGDWPLAIRRLERANEIMVETALEEGYLEDEFDALQLRAGEDARAAEEELKLRNGDGPSQLLINFMKQYGGKAPPDWDGWHPLTRK